MQQLLLVLVATAALIGGFYLSAQHFAEPAPGASGPLQETLIGRQRPDFRLGSNSGEFVTPADFEGKTLLLNFWATWCAPCRHEMPMLMDLQRNYADRGLQVIGIALDDVQSAREFAQVYGITYPILLGASDVMDTSVAYGNWKGVLPFSVLVDSDGIVRWQYAGELKPPEIVRLLDQHL
jgi:peroxiredoxin